MYGFYAADGLAMRKGMSKRCSTPVTVFQPTASRVTLHGDGSVKGASPWGHLVAGAVAGAASRSVSP